MIGEGDSLTLQQKDPGADQCGVKCSSEQMLRDIFLAYETFVFYN